jgi:FkbM family methyltransferase
MKILNLHTTIFRVFLAPFRGLGLGKKYRFLWTIYDAVFRIFAPKKPFVFQLNNYNFWMNPNEKVKHVRTWLQNYILQGEYEPDTTKLIEKIVKKGDTVIDIGASIGYFSINLSKIVGEGGKVFSFEPTREGFRYLCENKNLNDCKNIYPLNLAAWDKNEIVKMPKSDFAINAQWANGVNISDFLKNNYNIEEVNFIKMDIDGAEPWAIKGLADLIEKSKNLTMICEYYPKYIQASNGDPKFFHDMLEKFFHLEKIDGDYGDGYWNYLCTRK